MISARLTIQQLIFARNLASMRKVKFYTTAYQFAKSTPAVLKHLQDGISIQFRENEVNDFHYFWLRDHCRCTKCFNATTKQRQFDTYKIPLSIKPKEIELGDENLKIEWPDGHHTSFALSWLQSNKYGQNYHWSLIPDIKRTFWGEEIGKNLPSPVSYNDFIKDEKSILKALQNIAIYGFTFISNTPTNLEALQKAVDQIGFPINTIYGGLYEVTNADEEKNMEYNDLTYSNVALNGHTDGTYWLQSPGLQWFHCHYHTGSGGENLFIDGIGAAKKLKELYPDAFEFLSTTHIPARYKDTGYNGRFIGRVLAPVIQTDPHSKEIYQVRVNNDDRDVLSCLSYDDVGKFYDSFHKFMEILRSKNQELWIKLSPGNLIIVNNWRVLHGRASFTGRRSMAGCYMRQDDYLSKLRILQDKFYGLTN